MSALPMEGGLDLSAIFPGMDPETLRRLMAQFQPNDADKASARSDAFVDGGLALLANSRRGHEMEALGNAGLFGTQTYRSRLADTVKQRGASIAQAGSAYKLGRDIAVQTDALANDPFRPSTGAPPAAAPAAFPHGGTVGNAMGLPDGTGTAPPADVPAPSDAAAPPAGPIPPPPAPTGNLTQDYYARRAYRLAIASGDYGKAATIVADYGKPTVLAPGQTSVGPNGQVYASAPNIGPGMRMGANGVETMPGFTDTTGKIAGATEQAKADYDIVEIPMIENGRQTLVKVTRAQAANILSGRANQSAKLASGEQGATPKEARDLQGYGVSDPAALAGATEEAKAGGKNLADQRAAIDASAENAMGLKGRIADMRTLVEQFSPNMAAPQRQKLGELAYAFGASKETAEALAGGNVAAMQTFGKQAIQTAFEATRQAMGGQARIAQQEILLQVTANPNIAMTPQGIKTIFNYMDGVSDWQLAKQQAADRYQGEKGTMRGFEAAFNREHPITEYLPSVQELKDSLGASGTAAPQLSDAAKGNGTAKAALAAALAEPDAAKRAAALDTLRKRGAIK